MDLPAMRSLIDGGFEKFCVADKQAPSFATDDAGDCNGVKNAVQVPQRTGVAALVGIAQLDGAVDPENVVLSKSSMLAAFPIKSASGKLNSRFVELPFVLHNDAVMVGTTMSGGFFVVTDRSSKLYGRTVTIGQAPGVEMYPVGSSREGKSGEDSAAMYHEPMRRCDARLLRGFSWLMNAARERQEKGTLRTNVSLSPGSFRFGVVPDVGAAISLRFDRSCTDADHSKFWADNCIVESTKNGTWAIPGLDELSAEAEGDVIAVDGSHVIVKGEGHEHTYTMTPMEMGDHLRRMAGVAGAPPVVPTVSVGEHVYAGDSLFGPWAISQIDNTDIIQMIAATQPNKITSRIYLAQRQIRAWATLARGWQTERGHSAYPIEGAIPVSLSRTVLRVNSGNNDLRVQRIALSDNHARALRLDGMGIGYRIDLFHNSHWPTYRKRARVNNAKVTA